MAVAFDKLFAATSASVPSIVFPLPVVIVWPALLPTPTLLLPVVFIKD